LRLRKFTGNRLKLLGCLFFLLIAIAPATGNDKPLKKVTYLSLWLPQAQFAGYYVAYEKGIYKEYGLDVDIINGGPAQPPLDFLEQKKADFATLWLSTGIEKRSQGSRIVNICQIIQKSGLMLVAKKSSGIRQPQDINNKRVGLWDEVFEIQPRAFFKKFNLKVKVIPQSYTVNLFLRDGVDVASAMWYNEYHLILNSGYNPEELVTFFFYDYGLNAPEDGIYALEETYNNKPDVCCAFVKATLKGWQYAFDHPEEAVDIVLRYMEKAHVPANRVHQQWMLARIKDLTLVGNSGMLFGKLNRQDYDNVAKEMAENGLIKDAPEFSSFYKTCEAYDKK
jgi:NitT/TauT family transport system substrate-binding protein